MIGYTLRTLCFLPERMGIMKKYLSVVLIWIAALCCFSFAHAQERFVDERIGAELDVPEDWSVSGEDGQYLFLSADESIGISLVALGMTAEEFTPEVMEEMCQQIEGSLAIMPDYLLLASEEEKTQLVMVGLGNGAEMLSITCTFYSDDIDAAEDLLQTILLPLREDDFPEAAE